jgi:hypothetical protein
MDLPAEVLVHSAALGLKGGRATLVRVNPEGYYEVNLTFGERQHRTLLPIQETVLIFREPEEIDPAVIQEIER